MPLALLFLPRFLMQEAKAAHCACRLEGGGEEIADKATTDIRLRQRTSSDKNQRKKRYGETKESALSPPCAGWGVARRWPLKEQKESYNILLKNAGHSHFRRSGNLWGGCAGRLGKVFVPCGSCWICTLVSVFHYTSDHQLACSKETGNV